MAEANSTVTYKDIPGFHGYRVGDDGSVWSSWKRVHTAGVSGSRSEISGEWKQLKPHRGKDGYLTVNLSAFPRFVHRLVLAAFVGPCPEGMEGLHGDGNPGNNALSNLRWGTHADNMSDAIAHGTFPFGERNGRAKLTNDLAQQIRAEYESGKTTYPALANKYGMSLCALWSLVNKRTWA
jgi:hypothetical protein